MKLNFISKGYFKSIDQFVFIKQIGVGSFGKVQLALHVDTNKFYAVKIMSLARQDIDEKQIMLLERQIYLHSQVDHPHIIKLWDTIGNQKTVYLVMELAQNSSLFSYQTKKKVLSQNQAFKYFNQTLKAISYLHNLNIMHRDIKPQNILLDKNYNVKLCDLGWATQQIHQKRKTFCGTYQYMAPQMVFEKQYTYKIDVWALGILLYELLHGCAPFKAQSLQQIKQKFSKGFYQINTNFSKDLKSLIIDLLQFDPIKRPQLNSVQKYPWVQRMKSQIKYQGLKIKKQFSQYKQSKKQDLKKQAMSIVDLKKHKRFESLDYNQRTKQNDFKPQIKVQKIKQSQNKEDSKMSKFIERKHTQTQQQQAVKKMKKKCKTQGEQSLQKYQSEAIKPSASNKFLNVTNLSFKKRSQKQVASHYKTHSTKCSNFPQYSYPQNGKNQNFNMSKIKKISDKITQISQKIQKTDKKKSRLKTYNFF